MKEHGLRFSLAVLALSAALVVAAGMSHAADPTRYAKLCPATHEFFAFADVSVIRNSKLWADIKPIILNANAQAGLAAIEQFFGLRLPDDIDVVAASGKIGQDTQSILFLEGKLDRQRLEGFARLNPTFQELAKPSGKILAFMDQNKGTMTYGSFLSDRLLAVGPDAAAVETALESFAGRRVASLDQNPVVKNYLGDKLTSAMAVLIAVRPAALPPQTNQIPGIQNLRSLCAVLLDGPAALTVALQLEADSPVMAAKWNDIARGAIALGQIQTQSPKLAEIANQATSALNGNVVGMAASVKTTVLSDLIKERAAQGPRLGGRPGGARAKAGERQGLAPGAQPAPERPVSPQW
ncbi:MAG: hypothetical protein N3D11_06260 [Candidatus Sumerlaeia bacterium]|nr:hypothetical protein [Candidatus Sumerlaeia bacterium]